MKIEILGIGVMGSAMAKVLAAKKHKVFAFDVNVNKVRALKRFGVIFDAALKHLPTVDVIIISVKPYNLADLKFAQKISPGQILISIAAGVKIPKLQKLFGTKKIVRTMPNLGLSVGEGIAAWKSAGLNNLEKVKVKKIFNDISENFEVKNESQIDAVTAISGSGPAYFFYLANALETAAKSLGFDHKISRKLVEKTFSASAALQRGKRYQDLINQVASKKGTTEAALKVFDKHQTNRVIKSAVKTAQKRAKEISNE